ncbi:UPF0758 domain-containing protein [Streptomyces sp. NPDC007905]|uniref:UPF0758 domain-containing protein n=1 Tax=Streptomyces sp. NPDC007905 TaxID=3364788 RepID=UPI0036EF2748
MRMADVPVADRPRERLLDRGAEALSDRELLALLISSGTGVAMRWSWRGSSSPARRALQTLPDTGT